MSEIEQLLLHQRQRIVRSNHRIQLKTHGDSIDEQAHGAIDAGDFRGSPGHHSAIDHIRAIHEPGQQDSPGQPDDTA